MHGRADSPNGAAHSASLGLCATRAPTGVTGNMAVRPSEGTCRQCEVLSHTRVARSIVEAVIVS